MCAQKRAPKERQITREVAKILERIGIQEKDYGKAMKMLARAHVPSGDYGRVLELASTLPDLVGWRLTTEETKTAKGHFTFDHILVSKGIFNLVIHCAAGSALEKRGARQRAREFLDSMLDLNSLLKAGRITKEEWAEGAQNFSKSLIPEDNMSRVTWNVISAVLTPRVFWPLVLRPRTEREEAAREVRKERAIKYLIPSRKPVERPLTVEELRKSRGTFEIDLEPSPKKRRKRRKKKRG